MVKKTNKFINSADSAVDDSINGLILSHDNLATLDCCHRVVIRADIDKLKGGKQVTLLAGGGSGHEPFAAGFVGKGFLSAAVCGNIFASPPTSHITAGLNAIRNSAGIGVFVINYTGDRLNFGLALERFNASREKEDGEAEMVMIGDDIALEGSIAGRDVGRRGLAGAVLLLKIVGAMAEEGKDLKTITTTSRTINDNLGTIGVSLSACSLPGKGPMFELEADQMEFGLGIHGEPGFERSQYRTAKEVTKLLLEKLEGSQKLNLQKGEKLVVLLNNLGGTSQIELNILSGEICSWLYKRNYRLQRFYSENVMTSLNGHGISITILRLVSDDWLRYLDAVTDAPAWRMTHLPPKLSSNANEIRSTVTKQGIDKYVGATLSRENAKLVEAAIKKACIAIHEAADLLNALDGSAGDGDCGNTLKIGANKILKCLDEEKLRCDMPQSLFNEISQIFENEVGGTAGALYALMFSSAAQAFIESATAKEWHVALKNSLEAIMKYGQAKPGSRSMVDPLHAAVTAISCDNPEKVQWENAVKQAEKSAEETSNMIAQVGRASYTSALVQKEPDAGAIAVSIWLRAVYEAVYSK
ncbi:DAK1 domain containing protein [Brugia malayi]|uniref:Triokinase/FMN cyclase n=1 Tax=Brugia malayi TaxID=6279 RepID=A0A0H5SDC7_BRUMA|nr:DAK1 domain containing protein [Brugia malayi]CRZ21959.1 Bm6148 [Brugia malayi]VIO97614.1 DAK1 domain containing protein [Brugia malayi]